MIPYTGTPTATQPPDGVLPKPNGPFVIDIVQDGVDNVSAAVVNVPLKQAADAIAMLEETFLDPIVGDHFTGEALDTGKWSTPTSGTISFPDDTSHSASGAIQSTYTDPGGGAFSAYLKTKHGMGYGTGDFTAEGSLRISSDTNPNRNFITFGIGAFGGTLFIGFVREHTLGNNNWWLLSTDGVTTTKQDTGVAPSSSSYQILRVQRQSSVLTGFINGTQKAQIASTTNMSSLGFFGVEFSSDGTAGTNTWLADYLKIR